MSGGCQFCGSGAFTTHGRNIYRCGDCQRWWTLSLREEPLKRDEKAKPRRQGWLSRILSDFKTKFGLTGEIVNGAVVARRAP